jgi:hypothetical protein
MDAGRFGDGGKLVTAMSTILENKPVARGGLADKLAFYDGLQSVTNAIHNRKSVV